MKTKYKLIENIPYDKRTPTSYWIRVETIRFGFWKSVKHIGDYKIEDTYGELGDMPFFNKSCAKKRIKQLKNNN